MATPFSRCRAFCRWLLRAGHQTIKVDRVRRLRASVVSEGDRPTGATDGSDEDLTDFSPGAARPFSPLLMQGDGDRWWFKTVYGSHCGIGAPPILVYSGDWDVHWGYGVLTHRQMKRCPLWSHPTSVHTHSLSLASAPRVDPEMDTA